MLKLWMLLALLLCARMLEADEFLWRSFHPGVQCESTPSMVEMVTLSSCTSSRTSSPPTANNFVQHCKQMGMKYTLTQTLFNATDSQCVGPPTAAVGKTAAVVVEHDFVCRKLPNAGGSGMYVKTQCGSALPDFFTGPQLVITSYTNSSCSGVPTTRSLLLQRCALATQKRGKQDKYYHTFSYDYDSSPQGFVAIKEQRFDGSKSPKCSSGEMGFRSFRYKVGTSSPLCEADPSFPGRWYSGVSLVSVPTSMPTASPSLPLSPKPSSVPTLYPTAEPSVLPTAVPTALPTTLRPTQGPTRPSCKPTASPTPIPSVKPTASPTPIPSVRPTPAPTAISTAIPTAPSPAPTPQPSPQPSPQPTSLPSVLPSALPTFSPTTPSPAPTPQPSPQPSPQPTQLSAAPSVFIGAAASSLPDGSVLERNSLLGVVNLPAGGYSITFDFNPFARQQGASNNYRNILWLSSTDASFYHSRLPALFLQPAWTGLNPLALQSTLVFGSSNSEANYGTVLASNAWTTVTVTMDVYNSVLYTSLSGATTMSPQALATGVVPPSLLNQVYIYVGCMSGEAWCFPASGSMRNFVIAPIKPASSLSTTTSGLVLALDAANLASGASAWVDTVGGKSFTLYGGPTWSSAGGGSLVFVPSSSQYAQSPPLPSMSTWTIEVWHMYSGSTVGGYAMIVTDMVSNVNVNFGLGNILGDAASKVVMGFYASVLPWKTTAGVTLPTNSWLHIVASFDGATGNLYVNNQLVATANMQGAPTSSGQGIRLMRQWDGTSYWGGSLAVVNIYNSALSATQVQGNWFASASRFGYTSPNVFSTALPVVIVPSTTNPNGLSVSAGQLLGVISLPPSYVVSFDLFPLPDSNTKWRSILHFSASTRRFGDAGSRIPSVDFCEAGTCPGNGISVGAQFDSSNTYGYGASSTTGLAYSTWSTVTITVNNAPGAPSYFTCTVTGGASISLPYTTFTSSQRTWPTVYVYASFPAGQNIDSALANVRNVAVSAPMQLPVQYLPSSYILSTGVTVSQGKLLGIVTLPFAYTVSVDLSPNSVGTNWRNVMLMTASLKQVVEWGSRLPNIELCGHLFWCGQTGSGYMSPYVSYHANSKSAQSGGAYVGGMPALPTGLWSTVTITVDTADRFLLVGVSGAATVSSVGQALGAVQSATFPQAQVVSTSVTQYPLAYVFASSPYDTPADVNLRNFAIVTPDVLTPTSPLSYFPASMNPLGAAITSGQLLGTVSLPTVYQISFDYFQLADSRTSWRYIMDVSGTGQEWPWPNLDGTHMPRLIMNGDSNQGPPLAVEATFSCAYSGCYSYIRTGTGTNTGQAMVVNAWHTFTITVNLDVLFMTMQISGGISFQGATALTNVNTPTFRANAHIFTASSTLTAYGKIRNFLASAPPPLPAGAAAQSYYPSTTFPSGVLLAANTLLGSISLPAQYQVSLRIMPNSGGLQSGWRSVLRLDGTGFDSTRLPTLYLCDASTTAAYCGAGGTNGLEASMTPAGPSTAFVSLWTPKSMPFATWTQAVVTVDNIGLFMTLSTTGGLVTPTMTNTFPSVLYTTWSLVSIYASIPSNAAANVNIQNLVISAPAPLPVYYYPSASYPTGVSVQQGSLIGLVSLPSTFIVSLDVFINALPTTTYLDVLWLTATVTDTGFVGCRLPQLLLCPAADAGCKGFAASYVGSGTATAFQSNNQVSSGVALANSTWTSINIRVDQVNLVMALTAGSASASVALTSPSQVEWPSVLIYASMPIMSVARVNIRNLAITAVGAPSSVPTLAPTAVSTAAATAPPKLLMAGGSTCLLASADTKLYDAAGNYYLHYSSTGALAVRNSAGVIMWKVETDTTAYGAGAGSGNSLCMQGDGNLVVFTGFNTGAARWYTSTLLTGSNLYADVNGCFWVGAPGSTAYTYLQATFGGAQAESVCSSSCPGKLIFCPGAAFPTSPRALMTVRSKTADTATNALFCVNAIDSPVWYVGASTVHAVFVSTGSLVVYSGSSGYKTGQLGVFSTNTNTNPTSALCLQTDGTAQIGTVYGTRSAFGTGNSVVYTSAYNQYGGGTYATDFSLYMDSQGCMWIDRPSSQSRYATAFKQLLKPTGAVCDADTTGLPLLGKPLMVPGECHSASEQATFFDANGAYSLKYDSSGALVWYAPGSVAKYRLAAYINSPSYGSTNGGSTNNLCMQTDGHVVIYNGPGGQNGARFTSDTRGPGSSAVSFYSDANSCLWVGATNSTANTYFKATYGGDVIGVQCGGDAIAGNCQGSVLYCPGSFYSSPRPLLSVAASGNSNDVFCVSSKLSTVWWAPGANPNNYHYTFDYSGNLALYSSAAYMGGTKSDVSGTNSGRALCIQTDGNLVIYNGWSGQSTSNAGSAIWNTGAMSNPPQSFSLYMDTQACLWVGTSPRSRYNTAARQVYKPAGAVCDSGTYSPSAVPSPAPSTTPTLLPTRPSAAPTPAPTAPSPVPTTLLTGQIAYVDGLRASPAYTGAATFAGSEVTFDGVSQYLDFGSMYLNLGTKGFSAKFKVSWSLLRPWQRVFDINSGTGSYIFATAVPSTDTTATLRFVYVEGGVEQITEYTGTSIVTNTIYTLAIVYNPAVGATGSVTIFFNGAKVLTNTAMALKGTDKTYTYSYLGKSAYPADPYFKGSIYSMELYNLALTDAQASPPPPTAA